MKRLLGGLVLTLALTACSSGFEPDMPAIEKSIADDLSEQIDAEATVDCPDTIEWEPGDDFYCEASADDGSRSRLTVSMQNDEGEIFWQID